MSSSALVGTVIAGGEVDPALVAVLLSGGLVGMSIRTVFESIMSDDSDDGEGGSNDDASDAGDGGLMADGSAAEGDDLDGLGGLGGDDDLEEFDEGGLEDEGLGGGDETGGSVDELEHRLDELETEVGSLSSTVSTVRSENEQISESVDEVEENVRKLLDIYEMVTRGVNPFADDIDGGMGGGGAGDGSFGLFSEGELEGPEAGDLDEDVAQADPEGFFEDDLDGQSAQPAPSPEEAAPEPSGDDGFSEFEDVADASEGEAAGGTSFEDLKEEYEEGDDEGFEDFDGEDTSTEDPLETDDPEHADEDSEDEVTEDEESGAGAQPAEADSEPAQTTDPAPATPAQEPSSSVGPDQRGAGEQADVSGASTSQDGTAAAGTGKPYLATLPDGYAADLLVVEWLEYLVDRAGVRGTARAIDYYESIDWITPAVADELDAYLTGFDGGGDGTLTIDHHTKSLEFVSDLNGGTDAFAMERLAHGGGSDGIQR